MEPIVSTKFRDNRTGEIVTSIPLSQIAHFDELTTIYLRRNGTGWLARFVGGDLARDVVKRCGMSTVPLGYTALADDAEVLAHVQGAYPDAVVEVSQHD